MTTLKQDLQTAKNDNLIFSCNNSPTLSGKIKAIGDKWCTIEIVANPASYMQESNEQYADKIGNQFMMSAQNVWNAIYF